MGESTTIMDRTAVRTPMQWNNDKNGGFSNARPGKLTMPVVEGGYSPEHVNVSSQRHDPESLLMFIRKLTERYRASAEIGWGEFAVLTQRKANNAVLAHSVSNGHGRMIALHNLSPDSTVIDLVLDESVLPDPKGSYRLVDLLVDGSVTPVGDRGAVSVTLDGYGYRWLRVLAEGEKRLS